MAKLAAFLLVASVAVLSGCSSAPTQEPQSDYVELKPLIYDYSVVFDCAAETITDEGFQVAKADREAGTIETANVKEGEDHVRRVETGRRIRAKVVKSGPKEFVVRFAATRIERDASSSTQLGEWYYVGRDEVLLEKLKKRFDQEVEKRYRKPDKG